MRVPDSSHTGTAGQFWPSKAASWSMCSPVNEEDPGQAEPASSNHLSPVLQAAGEQNSPGMTVRGGWPAGGRGEHGQGAGSRVEVSRLKNSPNSFPLALHAPNLPS